jgi:acylglycerol lipase
MRAGNSTKNRSGVANAVSLALAFAWCCTSASAQFMQLDNEMEMVAPPTKHSKAPEITPMISWIDESVPVKGYLLCVHGLGLHKGTYHQFGERMAKLGWGVYACDVRGFGSFIEIGRAQTVDFPGALEDVRNALNMVRAQANGKPVFIVGESMGGAIALRITSLYPELVEGLISSVPAGERNAQVGDSVKVGLHLLTGPKKTMDVRKIVVDRSTDNQQLKDEWLQDHLARFDLSPMELIKFQKFMSENHAAAKKITSRPVLMIRGTEDKLVKQSGNEQLINEIPNPDKILVQVEGKEHLILEEGQFDDGVIKFITQWLDEHSKKKS